MNYCSLDMRKAIMELIAMVLITAGFQRKMSCNIRQRGQIENLADDLHQQGIAEKNYPQYGLRYYL